jgi:pilus assembly protein Flp/PilA
MINLKNRLTALWARQQGLTTVEYAIAGTLIALAVVTAFTNLGTAVAAQIAAITGFL